MLQANHARTFRVGHMACGIGAGARGFNQANPRVGHVSARFECAGGIDVDAGAIRNFERMTGVKGTVMDLFSREQYLAFHGKEPPAGWREAVPADIRRTFGRLDVMFSSYPCKGFSGLLSTKASETAKYQALNELTLRGMWLTLEAYKDDPIAIQLFENVPRIATRGRAFLDQIIQLFRAYGYLHAETVHDCGEIGGLGQSRKRFLLVFRHPAKVPPFLYQPHKFPLRGVGEIIGRLPLPGDTRGGAMHRVPMLQWKTWVRLAFVPAGKDWRALNDLRVEEGVLADYGIMPEREMHGHSLGVCAWDDPAPTITSARAPGQGRFSVADPRPSQGNQTYQQYGVKAWDESTVAISGQSAPGGGPYAVADPRPSDAGWNNEALGVRGWQDPARVVAGASRPANGAHSVADPRVDGHPKSVQLGVRPWDQPAACVKGDVSVGTGPYAVSDPRLGRVAHNNVFRIVPFDAPSPAVTGPGAPAGGIAVADPRPPERDGYKARKYKVTPYEGAAGTVIAASTTGEGAFAVADPRTGYSDETHANILKVTAFDEPAGTVTSGSGPTNGAISVADPRTGFNPNSHRNKLKVARYDEPAPTVTGSDRVGSGALSVADPRPACLKGDGDAYKTQGHYGVVGWTEPSGAVPAFAKNNNGSWSVADPREAPIDAPAVELPKPNERLVCRIVALDDTWHRPFTTLELAALQSLFDPEEVFTAGFDLDGTSDATKREWIGNAVPSAAARGMAETIGETLLLAELGETFTLSSRGIWVKPLALALAVDNDQHAYRLDAGEA